MDRLDGRHVLVGVGGSIAAYRACEVVRGLKELGASVRVAPTKAAAQFVTPLTFEALSGEPCLGGVLDMEGGKIPHVEEAYRADAAVLVPATADLLAKVAHGFADEALLATLLSLRGPLVIAPAMETRMWEHPATDENVKTLRGRNALFVGPVEGPLASGRSGKGRLASVEEILLHVVYALAPKDLQGRRFVITAGPTAEDIDPVRFLTNRSSGKMGTALARAAALRGARVDLVHGPMRAPVPSMPGIVAFPVRSALEMLDATLSLIHATDAALLCAAVADAKPVVYNAKKLKKTKGELAAIELTATEDILGTLGTHPAREQLVLVGFAAETGDVEKYARDKLVRKNCDLVCANDVSETGSGFDVETNRMLLVKKSGEDEWLPPSSKAEAAHRILDEVAALLAGRGGRGR
jgi:phosphopantothenoylcysteine decarboxylase / phosphopantothenate---cysteine ligase